MPHPVGLACCGVLFGQLGVLHEPIPHKHCQIGC